MHDLNRNDTYCNVRLFVVTKDGSAIATDDALFLKPPTTAEYEQLLFQEISYTTFTAYTATEIQYIIAALDWFAPDGAHSVFSMSLNPEDVWPTEFMEDEED